MATVSYTKQLESYKYYLYALLLYLPTIIGFNEVWFLVLVPVVLVFERAQILLYVEKLRRKYVSRGSIFGIILIFVILLFSVVNKVLNGNEIYCLKDYYSSFYLFPVTLVMGYLLSQKLVFRLILVFISLEIFVGLLEYFVGVRSFFIPFDQVTNVITNKSLLYESRVYGVSYSSSVLAYKILVGIILIERIKLSKAAGIVVRIVLIAGLILTFNRTVILVSLLYWSVLFIQYSVVFLTKKDWRTHIVSLITFCCIGLSFFVVGDQFLYQIGRGGHQSDNVNAPVSWKKDGDQGGEEIKLIAESPKKPSSADFSCREDHANDLLSVDSINNRPLESIIHSLDSVGTSGRKIIWFNYMAFIWDNPWFGNGSDKLLFKSWQQRKESYHLVHAHNSFIQMLGNNSLLITFLYFLFYVSKVRLRNIVPIAAFLLYSCGQYGVFWGMSFGDVFFAALLFYRPDSFD